MGEVDKEVNKEKKVDESNDTRRNDNTAVEADKTQLSGSCYCGNVVITVVGKPISVSICHCTICQQLNGAPFGIQSLHLSCNFSSNVNTDESDNLLWKQQTSKMVTRYRCKNCGSPVYASIRNGKTYAVPRSILLQQKQHHKQASSSSSKSKNTDAAEDCSGDVDASIKNDDELYKSYEPTHHMHYASRIMDINDGLPKYIGTSHPGRGVLWKEEEGEKEVPT